MNAAVELKPDYYLRNFKLLLNWVMQYHGELLEPQHLEFAAQFQRLPHSSQCLLVRLACRKGVWFRLNKLCYPEIGDITAAIEPLLIAGMLKENPQLHIQECAALLTKAEVLQVFVKPGGRQRQALKADLVAQLVLQHPHSRAWADWTGEQFGTLVAVQTQAVFDRLLLLFFGNHRQSLTEFVLQDLGLFRYERYQVEPSHRQFQNLQQVAQYQQLVTLGESLDQAGSAQELSLVAEQLPTCALNQGLARRLAKLQLRIALGLERYGHLQKAQSFYAASGLPPARERTVRILDKLGEPARAWAALQPLLDSPLNEQEAQVGVRMAPRLARKAGQSFQPEPVAPPASFTLNEGRLPAPQARIEERVRCYFETPETPCIYSENGLFNGLFGLWLWPQLFAPVEGAFSHPFHTGPLDLYEPEFGSRRPGIQALFDLLDSPLYTDILRERWEAKFGIANPLVHWGLLHRELLDTALACIPAAHLKAVFKRILFDIKANRSGMPDLVCFEPGRRCYRLLEVKAPGDRLQDNQLRWLQYFACHGIPAEVCYVQAD